MVIVMEVYSQEPDNCRPAEAAVLHITPRIQFWAREVRSAFDAACRTLSECGLETKGVSLEVPAETALRYYGNGDSVIEPEPPLTDEHFWPDGADDVERCISHRRATDPFAALGAVALPLEAEYAHVSQDGIYFSARIGETCNDTDLIEWATLLHPVEEERTA